MEVRTNTPAAVNWSASELPLPSLDENVQLLLSQLNVFLEDKNARKLCQALEWAGAGLDQYKIVDNHPKLPEWWGERKNKLFVPANYNAEALPSITPHPGIPLPENCTVFLNDKTDYSILLWGTNTLIYISPSASIPSAHLAIGDGFAFIGPNVRSTARLNLNCRNNGSIFLTNDILIGSDVKFQSDDCHAIISLTSNTRINPFGGTIVVKNHVWFGEGSLILGDTHVSENCIVGARAFMRGISTPPHSILAGVPAKVTRSGITWDSRDLPPNHPDLG